MAKIEVDSPQRMTPVQAAEFIGCSEYTIKDLARRKMIPSYRVGSRIRFNKTSLDKWIEKQEQENYIVA
jgi:excisionase family DNA binding protein